MKNLNIVARSRCKTTNKICYNDKLDAEFALAGCKSNASGSSRREVRYYKCSYCGKYHLTSQKLKQIGVNL